MSNTGNWNTGDWNTGNCNTGYRNTGDWNTGNCNTGNWNTGDCNTGNWNTGNWNNINYSTGFFNTIEIDNVRIFNKSFSRKEWDKLEKPAFIYFNLTKWIHSSDMTNEEKSSNPSHKITGGYLKEFEYKEAFKKSWDEATEDDRKKVFNLPNFDAEVFREISGIDVTKKDNSDKIKELEEAQEDLLKKAEEIQSKIKELSK